MEEVIMQFRELEGSKSQELLLPVEMIPHRLKEEPTQDYIRQSWQ
jgi:hypothetical protein